ncbi:MAG TPA: GGDEF domain-containing protein [Geminicoccaceae bacterium]|nr:GGDEF domain-containing protein [Geminicoccus sp.]HMU51532.1 GGDEF domain-containing protein [Geminicoccaceae bacterium]
MAGIARRAFWLALSLLGMAAIGLIDYATGSEYRVFPLYFLPVSLGAWHAGWPAAIGLAVLSSTVWVFTNVDIATQGDWFVIAVNFAILMIASGYVGALVTVLRHRLDAEHDLGRIDPLTGLPNRRAFQERGELLLAAAHRYGHPAVIACLDLDGFKVINDTKGHAEGDRALRALAAILAGQTRAADLVARLGGDEFAVLLIETEADAAASLLERLRLQIDAAMRAKHWPTTVTIGAACFRRPPASLDEAVRRADASLYAAKRAGKRRMLIEVVELSES